MYIYVRHSASTVIVLLGFCIILLLATGCQSTKPVPAAGASKEIPSDAQTLRTPVDPAPVSEAEPRRNSASNPSPVASVIRTPVPALKKAPVPQIDINLIIVGIETTDDKISLAKLLRSIPGVRRLTEVSFERPNRTLKMEVLFEGDNSLFKEQFFEAYRSSNLFVRLQEIRSSGNVMEFRLP